MTVLEQGTLELAQARTIPATKVAGGPPAPVIDIEQSSDLPEASTPRNIGRYLVLRRLGAGSMGIVYAAYDKDLDRKVAIKVVHSSRLAQAPGSSRLVREAQAMAQISHPNVVHVYEVGESAGHAEGVDERHIYIVMEFVPGTTLFHWQAKENLPPAEIVRMYIQAGEGLDAAHRSGLIHRDFKPDNVLIGDDERARVADFGLARLLRSGQPAEPESDIHGHPMSLEERLTEAGAIMGTPAYMSPEQHRGVEIDARSDQFSFCAALYEALFRQRPFAGETLHELAQNVLDNKVRTPPEIDLSPGIAQALIRGLRADPSLRFASMRELLDELRVGIDPVVETAPVRRARRWLSWGFAIMAIATSIPGISTDEQPPIEHIVPLPIIVLLVALVVLAFKFKRISRNKDQLRLILAISLFLVQCFIARLLAVRAGLTLDQYLAIDHVFLFGFGVTAAYRWMPKMWAGVVLTAISGLLTAISPEMFWKVPVVVYPLVAILYFIWWPKLATTDHLPSGHSSYARRGSA